MLNTDIFKFEFVDRDDERRVIDDFLNDWSKNIDYSLWVHGKRGTGKSYLLTEYVISNKQFVSVYVNTEINNNSSGHYLKSFISQINKAADLNFINYIRANYSSVTAIGQKAINVLLKLVDLDDVGLDELTSSITNHYTTKFGEKEHTVSVIKKYVKEALKKSKKIVFLLDNFTQCDSISLEAIIQIIHEFYTNQYIRFIVCTTDEDLETRDDIKSILAERIPNKQLLITPLQQKHLFTRMIEHNFDIDEDNIKLLTRGFELCQGYPQRFKEMLINLYADQGIIIDNNKAQFEADVFRKMLIKNVMSLDIDKLCKERKGVRTILQIIVLWGAPITSPIFYEFLEFYSASDLTPVLNEDVSQTIQILEDLHILTRSHEDRMLIYHFEHDSLKIAVSEYFRNDRSITFMHFSIYEYLMIQQEEQLHPYWRRYYKQLCAYHSYASQADDWIDINYSYGCSFYNSEHFCEAELIFNRFEPAFTSLTGEQLLTIGITYFKCGRYGKANDILTYIKSHGLMKNFSLEQNIILYIFLARTNSCLLNNEQALYAISQAEQISANETELHVATLAAKQSILFLTPGGFMEAKDIFDTLVSEKSENQKMTLVYQSSMDYYEGEKSLNYLKEGLILARKFSDHNVEGRILNNIGFEYLRCDRHSDAKQFFIDSISILKERQPHEQTYPYNNLAVLNMISGDWENALENIMEAIFWNKSIYASIVLKTNRMLCYFFTNNQKWEKISSELYDYINSRPIVDDKIYKKICINLSLLELKSNRKEKGIEILNNCKEYLKNEWPQGKYRFLQLHNKLIGNNTELLPLSGLSHKNYYYEIEFEPWLVNFSHE